MGKFKIHDKTGIGKQPENREKNCAVLSWAKRGQKEAGAARREEKARGDKHWQKAAGETSGTSAKNLLVLMEGKTKEKGEKTTLH